MKNTTLTLLIFSLLGLSCGNSNKENKMENKTERSEQLSKNETIEDSDFQKKEVAIIDTEFGEMVIDFFEGNAPKHVESFKIHARNGYYDKTIFHRVIPGFMIQGGDPNTKGDNNASYGTGGHAAKYFGIGCFC